MIVVLIHAYLIQAIISLIVPCQQITKECLQQNFTKMKDIVEWTRVADRSHCIINLIPDYYWAQNMSHLFVKIEFRNSEHTTKCDKVILSEKSVLHDSISLKVACVRSGFIVMYSLSFNTFNSLNYYHANWYEDEDNVIIMDCLKSPTPYFWNSLYSEKFKPKKNPKIWWKILEKYREDIEKELPKLLISQDDYEISSQVKKKRDQRSDSSNMLNFYCNKGNPFYLGSWL